MRDRLQKARFWLRGKLPAPTDVAFVGAFVSVVWGIAMIFVPAALILGGLAVGGGAYLIRGSS